MFKYVKNERGSAIEAIVVMSVVIVMLLVVTESMTSPILRGANEAGIEATKEVPKEVAKEEPKEAPTVENTVDTELFVEMITGLGIGIGVIFLIGLAIFGIVTFAQYTSEKEKRGPQTMQEMLRFMYRKKPKNLFTLVKGTTESHVYQFEVNQYEWLLNASNDEVDIKLHIERNLVLHITYHKSSDSFVRKNVKADAFTDKKTLKPLDKFISALLATEWHEHFSFNVVSETEELSKERPKSVVSTTPEEHFIITDLMLELEAHVENIIEDATTKEHFQAVIDDMHALHAYHLELDMETKHMIEYSLTNDLNRLLSLYEELNEDQKDNLAKEIQTRLHLMQEKVQDIKTKLDEKKVSEIKKALHLFDKRYQA